MKDKDSEHFVASQNKKKKLIQLKKQIRSVAYVFCDLCCLLVPTVKDFLVLVHPNLSQPYLVSSNNLRTLRKGVGAFSTEHMTNDGAWDDLQLSTALPHLQVAGSRQAQTHNDTQLDTPMKTSGYQKNSQGR